MRRRVGYAEKNGGVRVFELLYYCLIFITIIFKALQVSMLARVIPFPNSLSYVFIVAALILCLTKEVSKDDISKLGMWVLGVVIGISSFLTSGSTVLITTVAFSYAAKGFSRRRVSNVYAVSLFIALILVAAMQLFGFIPVVTYYRYGTSLLRHTFGFTHPNVFSFYLLAFLGALFFRNDEGLRKRDILILLVGAYIVYTYSQSYTVFAALVIAMAILFIYKFQAIKSFVNSHRKAFRRIVTLGMILAIGTVVYVVTHFSELPALDALGATAASRLKLANDGIRIYGIKLFGQKITQVGSLDRSVVVNDYFVIDCLYILLLVRDGIVASVYFWLAVSLSLKSAIQRKKMEAAIFTIAMLAYSIFETGLAFLCFGYIFAFYYVADDAIAVPLRLDGAERA